VTSLGSLIKTALVAGLVAGAAVAGFHWLVTEPVIDRAIEIEERSSQARGTPAEEPVVSRPAQRVGLILGFLLYGATWGLLFSVFFHLTRAWQPPAWTVARRGFLVAGLAGWSVAVFPFLKYPANPPGVGDPETIGYRQALYLAIIGLSVIGAGLVVGLHRSVSRAGRSGWPLVLAAYLVYLAVVYLAMPSNPDPVKMSPQVVWTFRVLSLAGLVLFWGILGGAFGWLSRQRGGQA